MKTRIIIVSFFLLVTSTFPAFASTFALSPSGNGVFLLQGIDLEGAGAIDVTISYDTSSLANPRVVLGSLVSGAMVAVNPNTPGIVRAAIIRITPIQGSGLIATISFDRRGSGAGKINSLNVRVSNVDGKPLPATGQVTNPPETAGETSGALQSSGAQAGATQSPTSPIVVPLIIAPGGTGESAATPPSSAVSENPQQTASPEGDREQRKEPTDVAKKFEDTSEQGAMTRQKKVYAPKSVLERFREYKGEKTVKALISLFDQDGVIGIRQEPPVVLSTGTTPVKAIFITTPGSKSSSDMAIMGARLLNLKSDPDYTNTWVAELMPEKGAYAASITIPQADIVIVYPLTVTPKVDIDLGKSGTVTEADFILFLKERGTATAPKFDLNKDGKRDYLDDYIFTANYLAATTGSGPAVKNK